MADAQTMELTLTNILIVYGPLGAGCVILGLACRMLYRDNKLMREQCDKEKQAAQATATAAAAAAAEENTKLQERYITKAETWMDKFSEVTTSAVNVVRAATKTPPGGGNPPGGST
jgi:hypothetical protein